MLTSHFPLKGGINWGRNPSANPFLKSETGFCLVPQAALNWKILLGHLGLLNSYDHGCVPPRQAP